MPGWTRRCSAAYRSIVAEPHAIFRAMNSAEAEIVCEQLRAEGIKCGAAEASVAGDPQSWMTLGSGRGATAWSVFVDESDVERARAVLERRGESSS